MSYNYATQEVYAPTIVGANNLDANERSALRQLTGTHPVDTIGSPIEKIEPTTGGFKLKGVLARQIGAIKLGTTPAPAAGAPAAPVAAQAVNPPQAPV